jgi:hypothetical protein
MLQGSTFTGGAWSTTPVTISTTVSQNNASLAMASLPGGNVALAYASTSGVEVGMFSGTGSTAAWGAFTAVPDVSMMNFKAPNAGLSLAAGVGGDVLELVFINANLALQHTRLLPSGTWTTPVTIDATFAYQTVAIASGP